MLPTVDGVIVNLEHMRSSRVYGDGVPVGDELPFTPVRFLPVGVPIDPVAGGSEMLALFRWVTHSTVRALVKIGGRVRERGRRGQQGVGASRRQRERDADVMPVRIEI